jgi:hypothetical protein
MHPSSLLRMAFASVFTAVLILCTSGCNSQPGDVLGLAYVAPATLNLRSELSQKNTTVAVLKYGERVQILDVRRRFVKVRTEKGAEGWIDSSQLLTPAQMEQIRRDSEHALSLPSEGSATVFEALNIHLEPNRQSPAFARIPETASVDVLAHKLSPKVTGPAPPPVFTFERPQTPARRERRKKEPKTGFKLPPRPPPPKPPANWLELSTGKVVAVPATAAPKKPAGKVIETPKKPVVMEDWTLVRTKDKQCGWVLSRNLIMSIPDEVAQYAEGKHITSYFDLGAVTDEEKGVKHNWLWTTLSEPASYDFNAWRVFLWNRKHHRFETSFRERDIEGYFPVHVDAPDSNALGRTFEIVTKEDDGKFWRHTYVFDGVRVHLTGKEEFHPGAAIAGAEGASELRVKTPQQGWFSRHWQSLKKRLSGHD